mgnify:CR=1 FL=1
MKTTRVREGVTEADLALLDRVPIVSSLDGIDVAHDLGLRELALEVEVSGGVSVVFAGVVPRDDDLVVAGGGWGGLAVLLEVGGQRQGWRGLALAAGTRLHSWGQPSLQVVLVTEVFEYWLLFPYWLLLFVWFICGFE